MKNSKFHTPASKEKIFKKEKKIAKNENMEEKIKIQHTGIHEKEIQK